MQYVDKAGLEKNSPKMKDYTDNKIGNIEQILDEIKWGGDLMSLADKSNYLIETKNQIKRSNKRKRC